MNKSAEPGIQVTETILSGHYPFPLGIIEIMASNIGLRGVQFANEVVVGEAGGGLISDCAQQLDEYFSGKRKTFSLPFDLQGTDFQKRVWMELLIIPFGKTISYLELARRLGDEKVIRAAGSANGKNPLAILVPCHRVIGSDGNLVGYAGGLHRKKWLLEFESGTQQTSLF